MCGKKALLLPPAEETGSLSAMKEQIRQSHLIERDSQLRESSVAEFVAGMERRRLTPKGWHSIFSLMRDGRDQSARLRRAAETVDVEQRLVQLSQVVSPYLQFVEGDAACEHTGLLLRDIWRYYRHTWVNVYKSLPGRSIMILVRDAAAPNHPVIGIAALGSSVVQSAIRDEWVGWNSEVFLRRLSEKPNTKMAKWILDSLEQLTKAIYTKDLRAEGICGSLDIQYPTDKVIEKLRREAQRAIEQHRRFPRAAYHKSQQTEPNGTLHWDAQAKSTLFRSKRCKTLASLLAIRHTLQEAGLISPSADRLKAALETASVRDAMRKIREALELVGLPSDPILRHGNWRVVYGVSLATNFGNVLLGLADRPKYLLPQTRPAQRTALIANFWRKRWLMLRISRPEILDAVSKHTLTYPIRHGARVPVMATDTQELLSYSPA